MTYTFKHLSLVAASLLFMGCEGGGSSSPTSIQNPTPSPIPIINDKTKPIFQTSESLSKKENKRYIADIQASDQTELEYTIKGGVDKDKFAIDKSTGTLIFKEKPDYENPTDIDSDNIYEVTIQVTDLGNNSISKDFTITIEDENESVAHTYEVKTLNGSNSYSIGTSPKSVYVLLSNSSETQTSSPTLTHNRKTVQTQKSMKRASTQIYAKRGRHAPAYIQAFNKNVKKFLKNTNTTRASKIVNTNLAPQKKDTVNTSKIFYTSVDTRDTSSGTLATARKVVSDISTVFGNKTLNIWVSNDSFGVGCKKTKCVTQAMVDALAETFLQSGDNNDIYDWVTNIYGEEWNAKASDKHSMFIGANDEITILLTDIDDDNNENGGVIGYFYSKDNYKKTNTSYSSNERVMFYIDAVMFANGDEESSWSIDHAWPKEVVSTLAHEFVHMIEFYQKGVLRGGNSDTWLAEMLAETTEDMIATKINHKGPRGVLPADGSAGEANNEEGRYGRFNDNNTLSLTTWSGALADYSKVSAFGTFLTRNYGGAQLLHDIMHTTSEDEKAVVDAVNKAAGVERKTFADLQKEWGIAVLLSDQDNLAEDAPTYNTGDFTVSHMGDVVYKMGSINFFNYTPQPSFTQCSTVSPQANCYYKVGDGLTGSVTIDLALDASMSAILIVK